MLVNPMSQPQTKYATAARFERSAVDPAADRPILERTDLVLACAHVLHTNGQSTQETVQAAERLGTQLGLRTTMIAHWEELELRAADGTGSQVSFERGSPIGMNMDRVASAMSAIANCAVGRPPIGAALENIKAIAHAPPAPTWLFTLAAAAGAAAMAAIFGVHHLKAVVLIMVSAAAGAVLRRTLARYSANTLLQPFCAALLAGMIGALAVRYNLSSSLRLVAVCPCMILVPGPHVLNGAMDLIAARINLGASRLVHAGLIILVISVGLLMGMGILSVALPVGEPGRAVSLWLDVIAGGRGGRRIQCFLLDTIAHVGVASRDRHAGSCREMGRSEGLCRSSDWHLGRLSFGRRDPCSSRASLADAIRRHWLCLGSIDDARRLPVQNGKRTCATR